MTKIDWTSIVNVWLVGWLIDYKGLPTHQGLFHATSLGFLFLSLISTSEGYLILKSSFSKISCSIKSISGIQLFIVRLYLYFFTFVFVFCLFICFCFLFVFFVLHMFRSNMNSFQTHLFDLYMGLKRVISLQVRVDLGKLVMKRVLHTSQISRNRALSSDGLVSYPEHWLERS